MKTLYKDDSVLVEENGSGEIIVTRMIGKRMTNNFLRITPTPNCLELTSQSSDFFPTSFNGLGGFVLKIKHDVNLYSDRNWEILE